MMWADFRTCPGLIVGHLSRRSTILIRGRGTARLKVVSQAPDASGQGLRLVLRLGEARPFYELEVVGESQPVQNRSRIDLRLLRGNSQPHQPGEPIEKLGHAGERCSDLDGDRFELRSAVVNHLSGV